MEDTSREVARRLLQIKAIKLSPQSPFTWASGRRSPIYCDNRIVLSYPEHRSYLRAALQALSSSFLPFEAVAGVATAGIAHGVLLADQLAQPFIYVRSQAKAHGRQNLIEGEVRPGASYLVVEDLISTGGSSLQAVQTLREAGAKVAGVIAIFTYGFAETAAAFAAADCPFACLTSYPILVEEAIALGLIDHQAHDLLQAWRQDPLQWSEEHA